MAGLRWLGLPGCVLAAAVAAAPAGKANLHVRMRVEGSGPRTVIFESGLGDTLNVWDAVQPRVAAGCALTVSYDRAGYDYALNYRAPVEPPLEPAAAEWVRCVLNENKLA